MPLIQAQKDIRILVDEDYRLSQVSEDFIGRKAYSLFKLRDMDVPIPPFLAVSSSIFSEYIRSNLEGKLTKDSTDDEIRKRVLNGEFPTELLQDELLTGYTRLSGFTDSWVAVRSSAVFPQTHKDLSFAGMLDTVLNVKGIDNVFTAIQHVYASLFTPKVFEYLHSYNLRISDIKVALVIQKMVQAEVSGVVFTVDPISQDENYLTIEAVFGLGDVIASGDITPDQYIIDKKTLDFKEKTIVPQEWMMVRNIKRKADGPTDQKVQISKPWQHQQKLENRYVKELSKIALVVEKKAGEPQDIEWVYESGRIWLLQCSKVRPVEIPLSLEESELKISPEIVNSAQEIARKEEELQNIKKSIESAKADRKKENSEIRAEQPVTSANATDVFSAKPLTRQVLKGTAKVSAHEPIYGGQKQPASTNSAPLPGERLFLTGIGASPVSRRGNIIIINGVLGIKQYENTIDEKTIVVIPDHIDGIDSILNKAGGVIADTGGMTSDIATRCRERGVPCIMGTHVATRMLRTGENVLVDGTVGAVYGIRDIASEYRVSSKAIEIDTKTAAPSPESMKPESTPKIQKPTIKTATKIFVHGGTARSVSSLIEILPYADGVCTFPLEMLYTEIGTHPEAMIADGKQTELIEVLRKGISSVAQAANGNPVILSFGVKSADQYRALSKGEKFEDLEKTPISPSTAGLVRLVNHPKEVSAVLKALRKVRNVDGWRTVSLSVEYPASPTYLAEFKKMLTSAGIRRSSTFKLLLTISTPSEAMIAEEFMKTGVDGLLIDIEKLSKHMMALTPEDSSVIKVIETIKSVAKDTPVILLMPKNSEHLLKHTFGIGFYGIGVHLSEIETMREKVAGMERERIFKR